MANGQNRDLESGEIIIPDLVKPFIEKIKTKDEDDEQHEQDINNVGVQDRGSVSMAIISTLVATCGSFEFGSCVGYSAPTQTAIREDLSLSLAQFSMFGSIVTIGAMLGAVTSGRISDFLGRKGAMRMSAVFCITGWLAVFFGKDVMSLDTGRFSTGFGMGVLSYVVPIYIAEISPKNLRGGLATLTTLMVVTGSSISFLIGSILTWRSLALAGIVPCVILIVGLWFVPESPRWLAQVGRQKEFLVSLQRLRGKNGDISDESSEIEMSVETLNCLPKPRIQDLFSSKFIRSVMIGIALMIFQQFGGVNGIQFYASDMFVQAGFSSGKLGTIAIACIQSPLTLLGMMLIDKCGRIPLLTVSAAGSCLGCFIAGTSFFFKSHGLFLEWVPFLAVCGVLTYMGFYSVGMGPIPWVVMSEILPANVKGIAGSLVVLVNWVGAWMVSFAFNFLMSWSASGVFYIFAAFSATAVVFVMKMVPETKGKTLEEIQDLINA